MKEEKDIISTALYQAEVGKMVLDYVGRLHPTIIQDAMERRAVRTLEAIRAVLEDGTRGGPECLEQVGALIALYHQELNVKIDRRSELE